MGTDVDARAGRLPVPGRCAELALLLALVPVGGAATAWVAFRLLSFFGPAFAVGALAVAVGAVVVLAAAALAVLHATGVGRAARMPRDLGQEGRPLTAVAADGTRLHVVVEGPEDAEVTVVFCHGWLVDLGTWHPQRAALTGSSVRRVFYDHRGHGRSSWRGLDRGVQGVRQLADDLAAVIDVAAPTGRLVLAGHSMGGMSVLAFVETHLATVRERVDGLLLCATGAGPLARSLDLGLPRWLPPARWVVRRYAVAMIALLGLLPLRVARVLGIAPWLLAARLLACAPYALDSVVAVTAGAMWRNRLHVAAECLAALLQHDERAVAPLLEGVPTVVVNAGQDRLIPPAMGAELARMLPDARHVLLPASGHMVTLEAPDAVTRAVLDLVGQAGVRDGQPAAGPLRPRAGAPG